MYRNLLLSSIAVYYAITNLSSSLSLCIADFQVSKNNNYECLFYNLMRNETYKFIGTVKRKKYQC